jgi:hypothetical protein
VFYVPPSSPSKLRYKQSRAGEDPEDVVGRNSENRQLTKNCDVAPWRPKNREAPDAGAIDPLAFICTISIAAMLRFASFGVRAPHSESACSLDPKKFRGRGAWAPAP